MTVSFFTIIISKYGNVCFLLVTWLVVVPIHSLNDFSASDPEDVAVTLDRGTSVTGVAVY